MCLVFDNGDKEYPYKEENKEIDEEEKKYYESYQNKSKEEIEQLKQELEKQRIKEKKNIENNQKLQEQVTKIQDIKSLQINENHISNIKLSDNQTYQEIFNFDLKEQTKIEAEKTLIDKIKTNKKFFEIGFEIRKTHQNQCPFCQSQNEESGIKKILDLYNQIYDNTYKMRMEKFKQNKQDLLNELDELIKAVSKLDLHKQQIFLELKQLDENYKITNIYSTNDEQTYTNQYIHIKDTKEIQKLKSKIKELINPNKEDITNLYTNVRNEFTTIEKFFIDIKNFIHQKNQEINKFKSDTNDENLKKLITESNIKIDEIGKKLNFINENKINKQKEKKEKEKEKTVMQEELDKLKHNFETAKNKYTKYCSDQVFSNLLDKIQEYFKKFNFSFQLKLKTASAKHKKEFPFAFQIFDIENNERDLKEGLSEGEIQVLSLCFFFAFLSIQKHKNKIVVFDDPITSLDNSNLGYLVDLIYDEAKNFSQTFIFTHYSTFFKFLRKRFHNKYYEYNLIKNQKEFGGSFICKSKNAKFIKKLQSFEDHLKKIPGLDIEFKVIEYGQYLRYELERFIKNDLLHWDKSIHEAIDGIKSNQKINDNDLDNIKKIYSFCNWTTSHVDIGDDHGLCQLKTKIEDFLKIIKKISYKNKNQ